MGMILSREETGWKLLKVMCGGKHLGLRKFEIDGEFEISGLYNEIFL